MRKEVLFQLQRKGGGAVLVYLFGKQRSSSFVSAVSIIAVSGLAFVALRRDLQLGQLRDLLSVGEATFYLKTNPCGGAAESAC